jgi:uncharacterized protein (UPF0210 family)
MKIRSLTYFIHPPAGLPAQIQAAAAHARSLSDALARAGVAVQTRRLATTPFPRWLDLEDPAAALRQAAQLEQTALAEGFNYTAIGPAGPLLPASFEILKQVLTRTGLFASACLTHGQQLHPRACRASADIIHHLSAVEEHGFANLRFTALGNVPAGSPFFPSAYAPADEMSFAIAVEGADLAVAAFSNAGSIAEAQTNLASRMLAAADLITAQVQSANPKIPFTGLDMTLAPFPDELTSIGAALEKLGVPALGQAGSAAAAAVLMSAMQAVKYPRTGFNGLMLPVLEDSRLAQQAARGTLGVQDLLLYSTLCGTGLDTIPLPGDVSEDQLTAILLDVAAISLRLNKALTARLMPIPGKLVGDRTDFDFAFFANSRVMNPDSAGVSGLLAGDEPFTILPRG